MPPPRVLLIQARITASMEQQELLCFAERCGLGPEAFRSANLACESPSLAWLEAADAVMIGGASEFAATDDYPWMPALLALVRQCAAEARPLFGSCWGHQIMARALGGTVVFDPALAEFGARPVYRTEAARTDALFGALPDAFRVNMGHQYRVAALPPGAVELAYSDTQRYQAFRMDGLPLYGTQFHSELDAHRMRERLLAYRAQYERELGSEEAFQAIVDELLHVGDADALLADFLRKFVPARES